MYNRTKRHMILINSRRNVAGAVVVGIVVSS